MKLQNKKFQKGIKERKCEKISKQVRNRYQKTFYQEYIAPRFLEFYIRSTVSLVICQIWIVLFRSK